MSKNKKRRRGDLGGDDPSGIIRHEPHKKRPHIALEYREKGQIDVADSVTRHLLPWARNSAHGLARRVTTPSGTRWVGQFQPSGMSRGGGYYKDN